MTPAIASAARYGGVFVSGQRPRLEGDRVGRFYIFFQQQNRVHNCFFVTRMRVKLPRAHDSAPIGISFAKIA